jgi:DNA polymerase III delta subunit
MNQPASQTSTVVSVNLICGDDSISRETARHRIVDAVAARTGNVAEFVFDSASQSLDDFLASRITYSLFAETRVFHLRHAQQLADAELKTLAVAIQTAEIPDTYLIIEADVPAKSRDTPERFSKFAASIAKSAQKFSETFQVIEFVRPREWELPQWLMENTPRLFGRSIGKREAELLIDLVGDDPMVLHGELQKIDLHLSPKKAIDREIIEEITGATRSASPYELAEALGKKNLLHTLEIIEAIFAESFSAPQHIAVLFRHFWALFRVRQFAVLYHDDMQMFIRPTGREKQNEIAMRIGIFAGILRENQKTRVYPAVIKSGVVDQARSFTDDQLKQVLRCLHAYDIGIKTGRIEPDKASLQLLCYKIVRVGALELS